MTTATIHIDGNASKAVQEFERLKARATGSLDHIAKSSDALTGTLGLLGASAAAVSFVGIVKGAIDSGDSINKLTQRTGLQAEALSQWQYAAKMADVSQETFTKGVKALNISIAQGLAGDKEKVALFKSLGVTLTDTNGKVKSTERVLMEVADAYKGANDGAGKAAVAQGLMARAGEEMIPLLNAGSEAIQGMKDEANALGLTISGDFARAAEDFNDNVARLATVSQRAGLELTGAVLPALSAVAQELVNTQRGSDGAGQSLAQLTGQGIATGIETLAVLGANVAFVFNGVGREVGGIAAQLVALATLDLDGFNAISEAMKEDAAKARAELDALEGRLLRLRKPAGDGGATEPAAPGAGSGGSKRDLNLAGAGAAAAAEREYSKLMKRIAERITLANEELTIGRELSEQEKFALKLVGDMDAAKKGLTAAERARVLGLLKEAEAADHALQAQRRHAKTVEDSAAVIARAYEDEQRAITAFADAQKKREEAQVKAAGDMLAAIEFETAALGLSNAAREEAIALRDLERQGIVKGTAAYEQYAEKIRAAIVQKGTVGEAIAQQKRLDDEWQKTADSIYDGLTDSLYRAFEAGRGFFGALWDSIKNTLKTTVLRVGVQAVAGTSLAATPAMAAAGGAGGPGGILGTVGNIGSMFGVGGLGGSLMAGAGWLTGATTFTGALGAGASLVGTGTAAGLMSGMGMIAGALGPIALGVAALMAFVKERGGPKADGRAGRTYSGIGDFDNSLAAGVTPALSGLQSQYDVLARQFGGQAAVQFGIGISRDPNGTSPTFLEVAGTRNGHALFSDFNRNVGRSDEELQAAMSEAISGALIKGLQGSGISQAFADYLAGIASDASAQAKQAAIQTASDVAAYTGQVRAMGTVFAGLAQLSVQARAGLIAAAGGLEALTQATATYYDNFYRAEEKRAATIASVGEALAAVGLSLDGIDLSAANAREQFRAMVDAVDTSTEAGRSQLATLMAVAGAVASLTPALDQAAPAVRDVAKAVDSLADAGRSAADIASERASLEAQLLQLLGDSVELRRRERAAIDESNRALFDRVALIQDSRGATDSAYAALERATAAERSRAELAADVAQEQIGTLRGIFDALRAEIRGLYDAAAPGLNTNAARAFIDQALATANATGYLPDQSELAAAIGSLRAIPSSSYGSAFEANRDRLQLAGKLSQLQGVAAKELTAAEKQLQAAKDQVRRLDETVAFARQQIDQMRGINTSVLSVRDAVDRLAAAMAREAAVTGKKVAATEQWTDTPLGRVWQSAGGAIGLQNAAGLTISGITGDQYTADAAREWIRTQDVAGDRASIVAKAIEQGISSTSLDALMGLPASYSAREALAMGLPSFDVGSDYIPDDMVARVHRGEKIVPADVNRRDGVDFQRMTRIMQQQLDEARAQARALVAVNQRMVKVLERWEGDGMPQTRVTA